MASSIRSTSEPASGPMSVRPPSVLAIAGIAVAVAVIWLVSELLRDQLLALIPNPLLHRQIKIALLILVGLDLLFVLSRLIARTSFGAFFERMEAQTDLRKAAVDAYAIGMLFALVPAIAMLVLAPVISTIMAAKAPAVIATLLPGLAPVPTTPPFKSEIVYYVILQASVFGVVAILWLLRLAGRPLLGARIHPVVPWVCFLAGGIGIALSPDWLPFLPWLLVMTAGVGWWFIRFTRLEPVVLVWFVADRAWDGLNRGWQFVSGRLGIGTGDAWTGAQATIRAIVLVMAIGGSIVVTLAMFFSWTPLTIPDDYYELDEKLLVDTGGSQVALPRSTIIECLYAPVACPVEESDIGNTPGLSQTLVQSAIWQGEVGRTYFHHSYVIVPALHFLKYGIDRAVPYLYGYGNTIYQALVMSLTGHPSISSYFRFLPWIEFSGLIVIALTVVYVTRSWVAGGVALALGTSAFYAVTFTAIFLAASFNPTRYFGVCLQIASMFYLFRGDAKKRIWFIPLALGASFFWNVEYAVLGALGQGFALLSPKLNVPLRTRAITVVLAILVAAILYLGLRPDGDIVASVELGFFNVAVPFIPTNGYFWFFAPILLIEIVLAACVLIFFRGGERHARLALMVIMFLILIKWIFNPSVPHQAFTGILFVPMMTLCVPWRDVPGFGSLANTVLSIGRVGGIVLVLSAGLATGAIDQGLSARFHERFSTPFLNTPWKTLGETVPAATPEAPIASRVAAFRSQLRPEDKVLILSPYDHLLAIYGNPARFCGHFDLMSNLVTTSVLEQTVQCAIDAKSLLVIVDDDLDKPCPVSEYDVLRVYPRCKVRYDAKQSLHDVQDRIPGLVEVAREAGLTFYRRP